MATKRHVPKFHRATPAVRREALVDATLRCLKQYGHEGVSVRRISAAAGVSIGLINHHFPSKSGLIAETYETLALSLARLDPPPGGKQSGVAARPIEQFFPRFVRARDPRSAVIQRVAGVLEHGGAFGRNTCRALQHLRQVPTPSWSRCSASWCDSGAAPPFRLRPAAIALSALLDGFWVELSLSPTVFKPREAIALCEDWVNALCQGGFPRLLAAPRAAKADAAPKRR